MSKKAIQSLTLLLLMMANSNFISEAATINLGDGWTKTTTGVNDHGLNADSTSSFIVGENATITTEGDYSNGAHAEDGSEVTLGDHATISTKGDGANGVHANYLAKITLGDHSIISTKEDWGFGVYAYDNAKVIFGNNATISTMGDEAGGIHASESGIIQLGDNVSITTEGDNSLGVQASHLAELTLGDNATISTVGDYADGVHADYLAKVTLGDHATITTAGDDAAGAHAYYFAEVTFGDHATISTMGDEAGGIHASESGIIQLGDNVTISTMGDEAGGIHASESGIIQLGDNVTISTMGDDADGVIANYDAEVTFGGNATIATEGAWSHGVHAEGGSEVTLGDHATISTVGDYAGGVWAHYPAEVTLGNHATISTVGDWAHGTFATSSAEVTLGDRVTISTEGDYADGIHASESGIIQLGDNATISTVGNDASGVYAYGLGTVILGNYSTITATGDWGHGVYNYASSNVFLSSGAVITTTGTDAHGIYGEYDGSTTVNGATIWVDDSKGSKAIYALEEANVHGSGIFHITGDIVTDSDGTVDLGFLSGSQFIGASDVGSGTINLEMSDTAQWQMAKDSTVTKLGFQNGGTVAFDTAANYGVLTVDQLVGDGGTFRMRTDIGGDGAGNNQGDLLVTTTSSAGDHFIQVANSGSVATDGTETLTIVDTNDGIATFSLTNAVDVGGYQYGLRRTLVDSSNWELYSTGSSSTTDAGVNLSYGSYLLNYAETQTLLKRLGDLRTGTQENGTWARVYGGKFKTNGDGFLRGFDMDYWGLQTGYDKKIEREDQRGVVYIGGFFGYSKGNLDYLSGSGTVDSKSLGAYWTHIHRNGFYADALFKYNWTESDFKNWDSAGTLVKTKGIDSEGFTASFEVGRRYFFNTTNQAGKKIRVEDRQGWYMEPQFQLTVGHQSSSRFTASNGLRVKADPYRSVLARVEAHVGYEVKTGKNPINVYAKLGVVKEFDGDMDYTLNGSKENTSYGGTWRVWGLGVTAKVGQNHDLYLEAERASGGKFTQSWGVNAGYRFSW